MTEQQTALEKRIETIRLLKELRQGTEKPGNTILRALRFLRASGEDKSDD